MRRLSGATGLQSDDDSDNAYGSIVRSEGDSESDMEPQGPPGTLRQSAQGAGDGVDDAMPLDSQETQPLPEGAVTGMFTEGAGDIAGPSLASVLAAEHQPPMEKQEEQLKVRRVSKKRQR